MDEQSAETRRQVRKTSPPLAFIGGLLALAAVVAAIVIVVWVLAG